VKVLVVGGGAREHALVWKLHLSPRVREVYCIPGNAGIFAMAHPVPVPLNDWDALALWARRTGIDLTVVGPEAPLVDGVVDRFQEVGAPIFGPSGSAAAIEGSKAWAKQFMERHGVPTARAIVAESLAEARHAAAAFGFPVVVKADGLAAGKGVTVAFGEADLQGALEDCFERRVFGEAGARVVVEEFLQGREVSVLAFSDGETVVPMVPASDYKRAFDNDEGPNTGGMGAYAPPRFVTADLMAHVEERILRPTVAGLAWEGRPYRGVLYAGLMITKDGPRVLEFNCRFGDPEAQVVLPLLKSDLVDVLLACVEGRLHEMTVEWLPEATCGVVLASEGYPGRFETGFPIEGLDDLDPGVLAFHAGTRYAGTGDETSSSRLGFFRSSRHGVAPIVTAGGRVLTLVARGPTLREARQRVYANVDRVRFTGRFYRRDIALRELEDAPDAGGPSPSSAADRDRTEQDSWPARSHAISSGEVMSVSETAAPLVAVLMGSESDRELMQGASDALTSLGIPHEVRVLSAHRTPERLRQYVLDAPSRGIRVFIAGAGGAAHLPGVIASWTTLPVIGVPLPTSEMRGVDSLHAIVQMPAGVPVACVAIGKSGAKNAGYLAASMLALADPGIRERYESFRRQQSEGARG
jgi:phosphoribosylamine--glycine ligase